MKMERMLTIQLTKKFWGASLLTAYELFNFRGQNGGSESCECLGSVWGKRNEYHFLAELATTTQLIEHRDKESVVGPDPWYHVLHNAWAVLDVSGLTYLGAFHSHPWSAAEIVEAKTDKNAPFSDEDFYGASEEDKASMADRTIEVIISLRPLTNASVNEYRWQQRGMIVSGQIDLAHATFSGWYKNDAGDVSQIPVTMDAAELFAINQNLDARGE